MINKNKSRIVGTKIVQVMGSWMLWYLMIVIAIYIGSVFYSNVFNDVKMSPSFRNEGFEASIAFLLGNSSRYFFLVCGILSLFTFLKYFVSMGVTRKSYFKGNMYGIVLLAVMFTGVTALIYSIESLILKGYDNNFGQMVLFFVKMVMDIILFYLIGWFIAVGFYHTKVFKGIVFILIAIVVVFIQSGIWGESLPLDFLSIITIESFSPVVICLISFFIISLFMFVIHRLTKNVAIKP